MLPAAVPSHHRRLAAVQARCDHTLSRERASVLSHSLLPGVDRYAGRLSFWRRGCIHNACRASDRRTATSLAARLSLRASGRPVLSTPFPQLLGCHCRSPSGAGGRHRHIICLASAACDCFCHGDAVILSPAATRNGPAGYIACTSSRPATCMIGERSQRP